MRKRDERGEKRGGGGEKGYLVQEYGEGGKESGGRREREIERGGERKKKRGRGRELIRESRRDMVGLSSWIG